MAAQIDKKIIEGRLVPWDIIIMKHKIWPFQKKKKYENIIYMKKIIAACFLVFYSNAYSLDKIDNFEQELKLLESGEIEKEDKLLQNVEAINLLNEIEQTTDEMTDDAVSVNMSAIKREPAIIENEKLNTDSNNNLIVSLKKQRIRSR